MYILWYQGTLKASTCCFLRLECSSRCSHRAHEYCWCDDGDDDCAGYCDCDDDHDDAGGGAEDDDEDDVAHGVH